MIPTDCKHCSGCSTCLPLHNMWERSWFVKLWYYQRIYYQFDVWPIIVTSLSTSWNCSRIVFKVFFPVSNTHLVERIWYFSLWYSTSQMTEPTVSNIWLGMNKPGLRKQNTSSLQFNFQKFTICKRFPHVLCYMYVL